MARNVLVPLDGSPFAEDALPLAAELARRMGSTLHLVHVIRPAATFDYKTPQDDLAWTQKVRDGADAYLAEISSGLSDGGTVTTRTAVLEGDVADAIGEYAKSSDVGLVVITSHGDGGLKRWWLGSVAERLIRTAPADVLLVRPWDDTEDRETLEPRFRKVLVPLDGSGAAEAAILPAQEVTRLFQAELVLTRIVPAPLELTSIYGVPGVQLAGDGHKALVDDAKAYLVEAAEKLGDPPPRAVVLEAAAAADGVVEAARKEEADLIVLSTHGRGGFKRVMLGSVADKVIRGTHLPVWVTRTE
ncbi:MAG: universal stress protein [Gemmatimonadota bacterium]